MGVHISGVVQFSCNTVEIAHTIIFLIITGAVQCNRFVHACGAGPVGLFGCLFEFTDL